MGTTFAHVHISAIFNASDGRLSLFETIDFEMKKISVHSSSTYSSKNAGRLRIEKNYYFFQLVRLFEKFECVVCIVIIIRYF